MYIRRVKWEYYKIQIIKLCMQYKAYVCILNLLKMEYAIYCYIYYDVLYAQRKKCFKCKIKWKLYVILSLYWINLIIKYCS